MRKGLEAVIDMTEEEFLREVEVQNVDEDSESGEEGEDGPE